MHLIFYFGRVECAELNSLVENAFVLFCFLVCLLLDSVSKRQMGDVRANIKFMSVIASEGDAEVFPTVLTKK